MMKIKLDRKKGIQKQIVSFYREQILTNSLEAESKLPTVRALGTELSVAPLTVTRAYKKLGQAGLVSIVQGSGTYVKRSSMAKSEHKDKGVRAYDWMLSIDDNLQRTQFATEFSTEHLSRGYNMFTSLLRGEDYPLEAIKKLLKKVVVDDPELLFKYSPVNGDHLTRRTIASYLKEIGHLEAKGSEIIVTSGSQQALDLIARTFVKAEDTVLMETPTFPGAIDTFLNQGCDIHAIPIEAGGINIDYLEEMIRKYSPKMLYLTPNINNPTGVITPNEKREMIVQICKTNNIMVIEDDPWSEFIEDKHAINLLKSYDEDGHVILVKGFSKLIGPGFRIGAIYTHGSILNRLITAKSSADLGSPLLTQRLLSEIISSGLLKETIRELKGLINEKLKCTVKALIHYGPGYLEWLHPDNGINIWVSLPEHLNADVFLKEYCHPNNLSFLTGRLCYPDEAVYNRCRMSFAALKITEIDEAIKLFCRLLEDYYSDVRKM